MVSRCLHTLATVGNRRTVSKTLTAWATSPIRASDTPIPAASPPSPPSALRPDRNGAARSSAGGVGAGSPAAKRVTCGPITIAGPLCARLWVALERRNRSLADCRPRRAACLLRRPGRAETADRGRAQRPDPGRPRRVPRPNSRTRAFHSGGRAA